jgi:hypothetical protein
MSHGELFRTSEKTWARIGFGEYRSSGSGSRVQDPKQSYCDLISSKRWDHFVTVTFRKPRRDNISMLRSVWDLVDSRGGCAHGNIDRAILVSEPHTTGYLHTHGLFHECRQLYPGGVFAHDYYQRLLRDRFGFSQASPIKHMAEVASYCSKYITKGSGDPGVDYGLFGDWTNL